MNSFSTDSAMMYFKVTIPTGGSDISLNADMLNLLIALGEKRTLVEIAKQTGRQLPVLRNILGKLIKLGLVEPVFQNPQKGTKYLGNTFLVALRSNLARAIGPIGEILIEETLETMKISKNKIPVFQAAELISNLGKKIPNTNVRHEFQNNMISVIRSSK